MKWSTATRVGPCPSNPFASFSVVARECTQSITVSRQKPKICKQGPVTKLEFRYPKMSQPSLTASTGLLGMGIDARAHYDRVASRGSDWFRRLLQGFARDNSVDVWRNVRRTPSQRICGTHRLELFGRRIRRSMHPGQMSQ